MVNVEQVQVLEKHPETCHKVLRIVNQYYPPIQTRSNHHMVVQEQPNRLHRAQFSKLQASFELKLI